MVHVRINGHAHCDIDMYVHAQGMQVNAFNQAIIENAKSKLASVRSQISDLLNQVSDQSSSDDATHGLHALLSNGLKVRSSKGSLYTVMKITDHDVTLQSSSGTRLTIINRDRFNDEFTLA